MQRVALTFAAAVVGLMSGSVFCAASAADKGVLTLSCKGTAKDNDDPLGRDSEIRSGDKQGKVVLDFDSLQMDILNWAKVKIAAPTDSQVQADLNAFDSGNGYHIKLDRYTGNASFQFLVHDAKTGETWYSHMFSGKCRKADRQGRPIKGTPDSGGF